MSKDALFEQKDGIKREKLAEQYTRKYRRQIQALDKSPLSKVRSLTATDVCNLGQILESFEGYVKMCEDDGSVTQLGTLPKVALDSLTVQFGASPINVIASIQPIEEVQGIVYFRDFIAQNTRGNVSSGQSLLSSLSVPDVFPVGYASTTTNNAPFLTNNGGTASFSNVALAGSEDFNSPINPQTLVLYGTVVFSSGTATFSNIVPDPVSGAFSQMVQEGTSGTYVGVYGTVNFANGTVDLTFTATPSSSTGAVQMFCNFQTVAEDNIDLQKAILQLQTKSINARFFALKSTFGMAEAYMLRKRLNVDIEEETARDLTAVINNEICNTAVGILSAQAPSGGVTWSRTPASGTSYFEHKMTLLDAMADADSFIVKQAGRGTVNCWIVGRTAANILSTFPGFQKVFDDNSFGPHIYGTLNGQVIVRVPYSFVLGDDQMIGIFKGAGNFEAPLVYAPYMPLVVTNTLPMAYNPLQQQKAAAVWAGLDPLITNFITTLTITEASFAY